MEQDSKQEKKPKRNILKRILQVLLYIFLTIIGINILLYVLLSIPYIQEKAKDFAVDELKKMLKTEISIEELRLNLFNHVVLNGVYIEDQSQDTLLYANHLSANLDPWKFVKNGELAITSINLDDFVINANQKDSVSDFNFQFVIDAFSSSDTTKVDTTKSSLTIQIKDIDVKNGRLNYDVLSKPLTPGEFNAAHISLYNLNANIDINSLDSDHFDIELNKFLVQEKSGLEIKSLTGHFYSNKSLLWLEGATLELPNSHLKLDKLKYDLSTEEFTINTQDTDIDPIDLIAFSPNLKYLTNSISLKTEITGKLPSIQINSFMLSYGNDTRLEASASIEDYLHYDSTAFNLSINKLKISPTAINSFAHVGDPTFIKPSILDTLGSINMKGALKGQLNKFELNAEVWTKQGCIALLSRGGADETFSNFDVNTKIETKNFNLGKLIGEDTGLRQLSAHFALDTKLKKEELFLKADGAIEQIGYKENTIRRIPLQAFYNPDKMGIKTDAQTSIGSIFIEADMTQAKVPDITFDVDIKDVQTNYFYKDSTWVDPKLSLCLNGKLKGLDIDNIVGSIRIDSISFVDSAFQFTPGSFVLDLAKIDEKNRYMKLTSSILSATIEGEYKLSTLGDETTNMLHGYLPSIFQEEIPIKQNFNDFTFSITVNNTEQLGRIFSLPANILKPSSLGGKINMRDREINVKGSIPSLKYDNYDIEYTRLNIVNMDSAFSVKLSSNLLMEKGAYSVYVGMNGANSVVQTFIDILSDSTEIDIEGHIESLTQFKRDEENNLITSFEMLPNTLSVGNLKINMMPAKVTNIKDRTTIKDLGIIIKNRPYFGIEGVISENESDILNVYFDKAEIGDILKAFEVDNVSACIDGSIKFQNLLAEPELHTDQLNVSDIVVFGDTLGTLNIDTQWSNDSGGIQLDASLKHQNKTNAQIVGYIQPTKDKVDIKMTMDRFPLHWAQPFAADMLNKLSGSISTGLHLKGNLKSPVLTGFLGFNETTIGIDYTNVTYSISDTINIVSGQMAFNNLKIKDSQGNTATANAVLTHKKLKDMKYSLNVNLNNLMVLNTENRTDSLFYGKVFASGNVQIKGDEENVNINMQVRNGKSSKLNVVIPATSEATDYKSVVFINVPEEKIDSTAIYEAEMRKQKEMVVKLAIGMTVTDDLDIGVIIDPTSGNTMHVKGNGNVNFTYNTATENMSIFGNYMVSQGNVKINLQSISKLEFKIRPNSQLKFVGDPLKTTFDINAYRRVKADLKTLSDNFANESNTKVSVDCELGIRGNLDKMDVTYGISLPDANENMQQQVSSIINTEEQKVRQFAYLIVSGSFYSDTGSSGANFTDGMWTNMASGKMSSVLNSAFGNMLGDKWEIGTNIESNDGTFSDMDMSVNVSRKFFDDKLKVNTNLGYRTDASAATDNALIGDFDVEYQLTPTWMLKAYNHTNDQFYKQAPITQGVGIVYTKEARTLKRLFQSFKRRRRNPTESPALPSDTIKPMDKQPAIIEENK